MAELRPVVNAGSVLEDNDQSVLAAFNPECHYLISDINFIPAATSSTIITKEVAVKFNQVEL